MTDDQREHSGFDTNTPSPARMYDWFLGGKDNFEADRQAGEKVLSLWSETAALTRANRRFLVRAVRHIAEQGVEQFLDLGTGIPTSPNVHEIARETNPAARVVYVDNDPVVTVHNRALRDVDDGVLSVQADLRDSAAVLGDPAVRALIDFDRPVAVLFIAVLHFVGRDEDAPGLVAAYRRAAAPGSYLALSTTSTDGVDPAIRQRVEAIYANSTAPLVSRTRPEVEALFDGCDLIDPGLVAVNEWRADEPSFTAGGLVGVGRVR